MNNAVLNASLVTDRLRDAAVHGAGRVQLLELSAELIQGAGSPYTSVYLYMLHGDELALEAYSGRETDHVRIPVGKGVCGAAVATGLDQNVGDVSARDNYLACNLFTKSELVVLIRRGDEILGQIDVDSDVIDPFNDAEVEATRRIAATLAELL